MIFLTCESYIAFNVGRIVNHYVFKAAGLLSRPMFYLLASDGVVADLAWVTFAWVSYDTPIVGMETSAWLERWLLVLLFLLSHAGVCPQNLSTSPDGRATHAAVRNTIGATNMCCTQARAPVAVRNARAAYVSLLWSVTVTL